MADSDATDGRIRLVQGNIATMPVDAVVTSASSALMGGGGVDGAVHRAAGPALLQALRQLDGCPEGEAVLTPGFELPAPWIIHAVGPIYVNGQFGEAEVLASAYRASLVLAEENQLRSIAFPCIGTGAFRYPRAAACEIAVTTVKTWLAEHTLPEVVYLCLFDAEDVPLYETCLGQSVIPVETLATA